jgi:hypothetical protein
MTYNWSDTLHSYGGTAAPSARSKEAFNGFQKQKKSIIGYDGPWWPGPPSPALAGKQTTTVITPNKGRRG